MPRTTRAQSMDALSSMATISGYKAVVVAAELAAAAFSDDDDGRGHDHAGASIDRRGGRGRAASDRDGEKAGGGRLGVRHAGGVERADPKSGRPFCRAADRAQDAQDARGYGQAQDDAFYDRQRELLGEVVSQSDVVITAAVIPGKKSPVLVTRKAVSRMAPGSVIIDMAAERGGNCEVTRPGELIVEDGVTVIGWFNLASTVPYHASQMYARNLSAFLLHLVKDGTVSLDRSDEIIRETLAHDWGARLSTPACSNSSRPRKSPRSARSEARPGDQPLCIHACRIHRI